jgi:hypothetical protein
MSSLVTEVDDCTSFRSLQQRASRPLLSVPEIGTCTLLRRNLHLYLHQSRGWVTCIQSARLGRDRSARGSRHVIRRMARRRTTVASTRATRRWRSWRARPVRRSSRARRRHVELRAAEARQQELVFVADRLPGAERYFTQLLDLLAKPARRHCRIQQDDRDRSAIDLSRIVERGGPAQPPMIDSLRCDARSTC